MAQNTRIEEPKRSLKRGSNERYAEPTERKRSTVVERRFEAPPPPRFDSALATSYERTSGEKKREDYTSSKRDDYSSSKRDDYSSKRDDYLPKRADYPAKRGDEFKRASDVVPPARHSSSNYHSNRTSESGSHKSTRYVESENRSSSFRGGRSGVIDDRVDLRKEKPLFPSSRGGGSGSAVTAGVKRYDLNSYSERQSSSVGNTGSGGGGTSSSGWHNSSHSSGGGSHGQHSSHTGGPAIMKSFANTIQSSGGVSSWQSKTNDDHWTRQVETGQDRYDRTYNERSGPYINEPANRQAMFVGRPQERYGGQISSRYENGKY